MMHPTTSERLQARQKALQKDEVACRGQQARLEAEPALPRILLPCGCKVEQFNHHGIKVVYCDRHENFVYSPRPGAGHDVFYFVTEENRP